MTAHSTFRLSPETKELIRSLARFYDLSMTDTVTKLAREDAEKRGFLPVSIVADPDSIYSVVSSASAGSRADRSSARPGRRPSALR